MPFDDYFSSSRQESPETRRELSSLDALRTKERKAKYIEVQASIYEGRQVSAVESLWFHKEREANRAAFKVGRARECWNR